jgi:hypothetical protein
MMDVEVDSSRQLLQVHWWSWRDGSRWSCGSGCEIVGTTAELAIRSDAFRRIRRANRSSLEFGVPMYLDSVSRDARTCRDGLTVLALVMSRVVGW